MEGQIDEPGRPKSVESWGRLRGHGQYTESLQDKGTRRPGFRPGRSACRVIGPTFVYGYVGVQVPPRRPPGPSVDLKASCKMTRTTRMVHIIAVTLLLASCSEGLTDPAATNIPQSPSFGATTIPGVAFNSASCTLANSTTGRSAAVGTSQMPTG